ncbi:VanZ family protein [Candidatus Parcubacteria bacterium]|nr:MAG: VanZ family protein [Candidatus Parcubacteria bacterium]
MTLGFRNVMYKRLISTIIFIAYSAILIKVMVFKDMPTIRIGHVMLNFGGAEAGHAPNFVPFTTIVPYLLGYKGLIIAGVNLVGNIALLVPIGFLAPLVYPNMTWKKSLALAVVAPLAIEIMQTVLRVGIFDIDDVILNALGVMIGYGTFTILAKCVRERKYIHMLTAAILFIGAVAGAFYVVYPWGQSVVNPGVGTGIDLCGGTGGNGQIIGVAGDSFTLEHNDGRNLMVNLTDRATIEASTGLVSLSDLKIGNRVTLVGDDNRDDSFIAEAVFVCSG